MKGVSTAIGALLLASTVVAVPMTDARKSAYERRQARRAARAARIASGNPFPLAVNHTSNADRISVGKANGAEFVSYDSNWAGAVADNTGITAVSANVNVPSASAPPGGK